MTDEYIEEIYALAREAFKGGQKAFQVQAFPFRMTAENMAKHVNHPKFEFWKMLKEGSDHFEVTNKQPKVDVCEKRYVFNRIAQEGERFDALQQCPPAQTSKSLALAFNQKQAKDQQVFEKILKRNIASPFVKPEEKPLTTNMSIKANPTIGALSFLEPEEALQTSPVTKAPVVQAPQAQPVQEAQPVQIEPAAAQPSEVQTSGTGNLETAPVPTPSPEQAVSPSQGSDVVSQPPVNTAAPDTPAPETAPTPKVIRSEVSRIAVPQQAPRVEPQS